MRRFWCPGRHCASSARELLVLAPHAPVR
ncbi:hypothetical protein A2U01_0081342, partial [Trifolium medium]|nr:hypothetical protein [Trifolium medium]